MYSSVPRKVLKEKYQGDAESDEMDEVEDDDDETDNGANGSSFRIIEQQSIPSENYPSEKTIKPDSEGT